MSIYSLLLHSSSTARAHHNVDQGDTHVTIVCHDTLQMAGYEHGGTTESVTKLWSSRPGISKAMKAVPPWTLPQVWSK